MRDNHKRLNKSLIDYTAVEPHEPKTFWVLGGPKDNFNFKFDFFFFNILFVERNIHRFCHLLSLSEMSFDVNHFETSNNSEMNEIVPLFDEFIVFFLRFLFSNSLCQTQMRVLWPVGFDDLTYDEFLSQHLKIEHTHTVWCTTPSCGLILGTIFRMLDLFVAYVNDSELKTERKKKNNHTLNKIHEKIITFIRRLWSVITFGIRFVYHSHFT